MRETLRTGWEWFRERAEGTHTRMWLAALSFTESFIFIIPPDPLLAGIMLSGSRRWIYYSVFTTLASLAGALVGYVLAAGFFSVFGAPIVSFYGLEKELGTVQVLFNDNALIALLFAAISPIPFKLFVLTAGFLHTPLWMLVLATIVGRGFRYGLVAYATYRWGEDALSFVKRYTTHITVATVLCVIVFFVYLLLK